MYQQEKNSEKPQI